MKENTETRYKKIVEEIKGEKMVWDFNDFLAEADTSADYKISDKKKTLGHWRFIWSAAALAVFCSLYFSLKQYKPTDTEAYATTEIHEKPAQAEASKTTEKPETVIENTIGNSAGTTVPQPYAKADGDLLGEILPKRGRMKRISRARYVKVSKKIPVADKWEAIAKAEKTETYEADYVTVNGKKIYSEDEAIEITRQAVNMFASNVASTVDQARVINELRIQL